MSAVYGTGYINSQEITIDCGLTSRYAAHWTPVGAFREIVRNWQDGIIEANKPYRHQIWVKWRENENEIVYKATKRSEHQCLGYIRWSRFRGLGTVDVMNRGAILQPWHLGMGNTGNLDTDRRLGPANVLNASYGEGLKIALLVLMREPQGHAVRCVCRNIWWTFYFKEEKLVAKATRTAPASSIYSIYRDADRETHTPGCFLLPHTEASSEFVQFFIDGTGYGEKGLEARREVTREEFKRWTKAALFLQQFDDDQIVKTPRGDLIIDPEYSGCLYLNGFLLDKPTIGNSASVTGKTLNFGYNLTLGTTNRERQYTAPVSIESIGIYFIWDYAILQKKDLVETLDRLLDSEDPEYADVASADTWMLSHRNIMDSLKDYLLKQCKGTWYHEAAEKSENTRFEYIVQALGYKPRELRGTYWKLLRQAGFRTAAEQEQKEKISQESSLAPVPDNVFARTMNRLVLAGLKSCAQTANICAFFVKGNSSRLDMLYYDHAQVLKIKEKWLTIAGAAVELGMPESIPMYYLLFHSARRLLADTIQQMPLDRFSEGGRNSYQNRRQAISKVDQRILEYTQIKKGLKYTYRKSRKLDRLKIAWDPTAG
ncbi:hypothetical protein GGR52DRAFT_243207 [Hypoxylon sp. FL1284]|nr:hypothetical protein GGR52DRAFT_243207 [Hypoxylon sp. FL1284]